MENGRNQGPGLSCSREPQRLVKFSDTTTGSSMPSPRLVATGRRPHPEQPHPARGTLKSTRRRGEITALTAPPSTCPDDWSSLDPRATQGRLHPVTRGRFRAVHRQGLLCGGPLGRASVMSRLAASAAGSPYRPWKPIGAAVRVAALRRLNLLRLNACNTRPSSLAARNDRSRLQAELGREKLLHGRGRRHSRRLVVEERPAPVVAGNVGIVGLAGLGIDELSPFSFHQ
jgi:hypothetical protein